MKFDKNDLLYQYFISLWEIEFRSRDLEMIEDYFTKILQGIV